MKHVLVVEDDINITNLLEIHLKDLQCKVSKAHDGKTGLQMALDLKPDLVILDISMPEMDGIAVCQRIRAVQTTPIMMLTAKAEEIDKVLGLEIGADDYITKPFHLREVMARVKAIFRRTEFSREATSMPGAVLRFPGMEIDIDKRKVVANGTKVELSPKEFELLVLMASHPGRSYSRSDLLKLIWGYDFDGYEHTVNSHINRLRAKIEADMSDPVFILTTWSIGYRFNEDL